MKFKQHLIINIKFTQVSDFSDLLTTKI